MWRCPDTLWYYFFFHGGDGGGGLSSQGVTPNPIRYHRSSGFVEPPVSEALRPRSCHPRGVTILCKLPTPVDTQMAVNRYPRHPAPHLGGCHLGRGRHSNHPKGDSPILYHPPRRGPPSARWIRGGRPAMLASATVSPKGMPPPRGRVALVLSPLASLAET